ncbi:MAG: glycerol acyltransferase [Bacteroidetes bacterium]|nr:MAG: glycerol acyltransferase [Bacteroidota bacterium]TAG87137.1 MAG: glycerol acyltransferase [Bacteroidota bacterium]
MEKFIDIDAIFKAKNPKLYKWMPRFVISYLKKIAHQEECNNFMIKNKDKEGIDFCKQVINEFNIKVEVIGLENIPKEGGCIFASNHPLGGMDAMAVVAKISDIRPDIQFIVNDLLLYLTNLKNIFVGVNKVGKNAMESLRVVDELFASEKAVFLFPAGLVSRKQKGVIKDLEWKKTFVTRAKKYKRNVVPVYIDGKLSNFFYNLANFRKKIGMKANIEMMYLADEMFKQKNQTIKIIFGNPIPYTYFDKSKSDAEWAEIIKEQTYKLKP